MEGDNTHQADHNRDQSVEKPDKDLPRQHVMQRYKELVEDQETAADKIFIGGYGLESLDNGR